MYTGRADQAWRGARLGNAKHGPDVGVVPLVGRCPRARGHAAGITPGSFMCYRSCLWSSCFFFNGCKDNGSLGLPGMKRPLKALPRAFDTADPSRRGGKARNSTNSPIN